MRSAGDYCEDPRLSTFCDAVFATRCCGGFKVKLMVEVQFLLIEWASRLPKQRGTASHRRSDDRVETSNQSDAEDLAPW